MPSVNMEVKDILRSKSSAPLPGERLGIDLPYHHKVGTIGEGPHPHRAHQPAHPWVLRSAWLPPAPCSYCL